MSDRTTLGDRMKEYEAVTRAHLLRRTPVIIRVDGRAFHTFTKRLVAELPPKKNQWDTQDQYVVDPSLKDTPYSVLLHEVMNATAVTLFDAIQNAAFVYTQSDEISIFLRDWDRHETQQWFAGGIQKIASLSASIATSAFNYQFERVFNLKPTWWGALAHFDSRVFNLPMEEVTNYFIWRQQDATRNSVQMYGRHFFSQKEMNGKNNSQVQDMLMLQKGKNWNDLPTWMKRGSCVSYRSDWNMFMSFHPANVDDNPPIFTQDRAYVEQHLTAPVDDMKVRAVFDEKE